MQHLMMAATAVVTPMGITRGLALPPAAPAQHRLIGKMVMMVMVMMQTALQRRHRQYGGAPMTTKRGAGKKGLATARPCMAACLAGVAPAHAWARAREAAPRPAAARSCGVCTWR